MEILKYHSKKGNNTVFTVIFMIDRLVDALYESESEFMLFEKKYEKLSRNQMHCYN